MSLIIEVADLVKTEIEEAELPLTVAVRRAYKPVYSLADRKGALVTVIPSQVEITRAARGRDRYDVSIEVGVQKKFTVGDNAELDPLMALVEAIGDLFRNKRFMESSQPVGIAINNSPIFAPEHIDQKRMFTSILILTFTVFR